MAMTVYFFEFTAKIFLFFAVGFLLFLVFKNRNRNEEVLIAAAYMTGFEVFSRMTGGAFSYEFAKYSVIIFLGLGMFYRGFTRRSWPYFVFIICLIPGILFSAINLNYETSVANAVGFNLSGPVCLGISALYCFERKLRPKQMQQVLLAALLPLLTMTLYLYVYTPSIRAVLTGTQSNFEASGGFGPNQVATVLGLGMFILFSRLIVLKNRTINIIDLTLLGFMSYRAIVTFSRGGVITAAACALVFLLIYFAYSGPREKTNLLPKFIMVALVIIGTWAYTSISTLGLIDKRYANQDAAGREKADLTTGRLDLLTAELDAFVKYPLTGIGVGKIVEYRFEQTGRMSATHNEVSRVLSEHGLFGLLALSILIFTPLFSNPRRRSNLFFLSFLLFWFLTINHSSMRIAAPAFIYGLALIHIVSGKKRPTLHRK